MSLDLITDIRQSPSASDVVAKYLRAAIASGELPEGELVNQEEIAKLFNVSKIPVREALKRLEAEGLVVFQRNRGAMVTSLSKAEIAQIFQTRAILESNAVRLSVPNLTAHDLDQAERLRESFAREGSVAQWTELNWAFHAVLYAGANNPFLVNLIRSVNERVERYLRIQLTQTDSLDIADREHREILDACRKHDADKAAELVHAHVLNSGRYAWLPR